MFAFSLHVTCWTVSPFVTAGIMLIALTARGIIPMQHGRSGKTWPCECRFFPDLEWYVDVMITLIERAGEFSTKDIWHSTVQLITNNDDLHKYAATKVCVNKVLAWQKALAWMAISIN